MCRLPEHAVLLSVTLNLLTQFQHMSHSKKKIDEDKKNYLKNHNEISERLSGRKSHGKSFLDRFDPFLF